MRKIVLTVLFVLQTSALGQTIEGPINAPGAQIIREEERRISGSDSSVSGSRPRNPLKFTIPKELKEKLEITKSDKAKYLNGEKFNLVKLWSNQCLNASKVVNVEKDKDCLAQSGYEIASVYSFENKDYFLQGERGIFSTDRIYPNARIGLVKERFSAANISSPTNLLTQIMTDLGETPLAAVEKNSSEVVKLSAVWLFDEDGKAVWRQNQKTSALKYSDDLPAVINHTYLLRSIFIDNQSSSHLRIKETIYAFHLAGFEDKIAAIVWKKISSKWI